MVIAKRSGKRNYYPKAAAMAKMNPGARFGIAVAMAGEVSLIPFKNKDWNSVTLKQTPNVVSLNYQ